MNCLGFERKQANSDYIHGLSENSAARLSRLHLSHEGKVMVILKQIQAVILSFTITMTVISGYAASREGAAELRSPESMQTETPTSSSKPSPKELQQLVAPIALYPDGLVAQVLAGSTYPTQIVEAERWMQENKNLQGQDLAKA